ncbi:hypothetical protein FVE85_3908 [Porphyridium purpureum]|uniref:Transmembrane protein n=1 Tax=Porphyridium purpureum TaxID=35688 RepID=A0A5J4YT19_PORPP|nr:hypothetical protein FVE85_3908 [Porphyridium purpureum]|eukprot:POR3200..scf229_5
MARTPRCPSVVLLALCVLIATGLPLLVAAERNRKLRFTNLDVSGDLRSGPAAAPASVSAAAATMSNTQDDAVLSPLVDGRDTGGSETRSMSQRHVQKSVATEIEHAVSSMYSDKSAAEDKRSALESGREGVAEAASHFVWKAYTYLLARFLSNSEIANSSKEETQSPVYRSRVLISTQTYEDGPDETIQGFRDGEPPSAMSDAAHDATFRAEDRSTQTSVELSDTFLTRNASITPHAVPAPVDADRRLIGDVNASVGLERASAFPMDRLGVALVFCGICAACIVTVAAKPPRDITVASAHHSWALFRRCGLLQQEGDEFHDLEAGMRRFRHESSSILRPMLEDPLSGYLQLHNDKGFQGANLHSISIPTDVKVFDHIV